MKNKKIKESNYFSIVVADPAAKKKNSLKILRPFLSYFYPLPL